MKKILLILPLFLVLGCGSAGKFDGTWELIADACSAIFDFDDVVELDKAGTTDIVGDEFEIYNVSSATSDEDRALIGTMIFGDGDQEFLMCLDPEGEIDIEKCLILCAGTVMDGVASFFCEDGEGGACGPVSYEQQI